MSDLLNIGASSLRAYQTALTTVSENIANASTAGYTRKSADLSALSATSGGITARAVSSGQGVVVSGVTRASDAIKTADVRTASSDLSRTETGVQWLTEIQSALSGNDLGDRLTSFFNSATAVAADPTATAPRDTMLESATAVAQAFTGTGTALDQISTDLDTTATAAAANLDSLGTALGKVNDALGRTATGTSGAAQLGDQRDQILEQMSAISDVTVTTDAAGRATVQLGDASGPVLVAGGEAGHVAYTRNDDGTAAFTVQRAGTISAVSPNGGVLAGVVDGAARIAAAKTQLDTVATDFASGVNAVQAQGQDLDGQTGAAIFTVGASATDIGVAMTDSRGIAAAAVDGGTRDNSNLTALASLRTTGAAEAKTTALVSGNAATLASRTSVADAQSAIRDTAVAARDSVSGVNLDSEAVDLLRFQQAYQASARVIQVARETLQSILDLH